MSAKYLGYILGFGNTVHFEEMFNHKLLYTYQNRVNYYYLNIFIGEHQKPFPFCGDRRMRNFREQRSASPFSPFNSLRIATHCGWHTITRSCLKVVQFMRWKYTIQRVPRGWVFISKLMTEHYVSIKFSSHNNLGCFNRIVITSVTSLLNKPLLVYQQFISAKFFKTQQCRRRQNLSSYRILMIPSDCQIYLPSCLRAR